MYKRQLGIIISLALALTPVSAYAGGSVEQDSAIQDEASSIELEEIKEMVDNLDEGTDYNEYEAVILADSEEDVIKAAEEYGGQVKSFESGVGVIELEKTFSETIDEAIEEEKVQSADELVTESSSDISILPQLQFELTDVDSSEITDEYYSSQWHHQTISDDLMWNEGYTGDGVKVCVIDSGISTTSEVYSQVVAEKDFTNTGIEDTNGHGTHVAGIIAAPVDGTGTVGVAPEASLYIAKVTNDTELNMSDVFSAWQWAIDNDVDVVNMSFSAKASKMTAVLPTINEYMSEFRDKGIVPVAAAGNDASSTENAPACCDYVFAVGASDADDSLAYFSNYGSWVDIAVPGANIYSTYTGTTYQYLSGTSMAAPVMAGVFALLHDTDFVSDSDDDSEYDEMEDRFDAVKTDTVYKYGSHSVEGGIDLSGYNFYGEDDSDDEDDSKDNGDDNDSRDEENEDSGNDTGVGSNTVTVSNNYPTTSVNFGAYTISYPEKITFRNSKKATLGSSDVTVSGPNGTLPISKIKLKKATKTGSTTFKVKLDSSVDRDVRKALGKVAIPVTITAYNVSDSDSVTVSRKSNGTIKKITVNGIKCKKTEWNVTTDSEGTSISFSGRFSGTVVVGQ